jgi:hypothetical protein
MTKKPLTLFFATIMSLVSLASLGLAVMIYRSCSVDGNCGLGSLWSVIFFIIFILTFIISLFTFNCDKKWGLAGLSLFSLVVSISLIYLAWQSIDYTFWLNPLKSSVIFFIFILFISVVVTTSLFNAFYKLSKKDESQ